MRLQAAERNFKAKTSTRSNSPPRLPVGIVAEELEEEPKEEAAGGS